MKNKFKVGDKVKTINDPEIGEVLDFSYDSAVGYTYRISSKEVDIINKIIVDGVKICKENEMEAAK